MKKTAITGAAAVLAAAINRLIDDETKQEVIDGAKHAGQGIVLGVRDRKRAHDHAKSVGGKAHPEFIDSRGHWVVWKNGRPLASYPRRDGDLDAVLEESKHYRT